MEPTTGPSERSDTQETSISRRTLLKGTAATAVAATGLAATSSSAAASSHEFGILDTRDDPPTTENIPTGVDEVVLFIHGWFGDMGAEDQAEELQESLNNAGYDEPMVVVKWPATTINYFGAQDGAAEVGADLAAWLGDYLEDNPDTTVRLAGHSLGGLATLETLEAIDGEYVVDSVAPMGAATSNDNVCEGGRLHDGIVSSAGEVHNVWSADDGIVGSAYFWGGLGSDGADCGGWFSGDLPDNYEDVDVTEDVDSHMGFMGSDLVGQELADRWDGATDPENGDDGDGDDGDDDDDGFCWFFC